MAAGGALAAAGDADDRIFEGRFAGAVREVVYLGVNTRYIVSLDGGGELVVVQQNQATSSMQALAARGRQVRLIWDREHNRTVEAPGPTIEREEISA